MKLKQIFIPTKVAKTGMTVREVVLECSRVNIPALPFCTKSGRIAGRVTLKNIMKISCLPEYMIDSARILGEEMSCMEDLESKAKRLFDTPVDPYVQEPALSLSSEAPAIKALALMEQNDTSYLFVVDDGQYRGAVTIQCLAKMLARLDQQG
jgi:signal-transduction protein with cAMP-binding, CBS, and nucleotidyltransferase domain